MRRQSIPGPAGQDLPPLGQASSFLLSERPADVTEPQLLRDLDFESGAWSTMLARLGAQHDSLDLREYGCTSVREVIQGATPPRRLGGRLPVIVTRLVRLFKDADAVVKDPTGSIQAMVHRSVFSAFPACLEEGSVILVKDNATIFTPSAGAFVINLVDHAIEAIFPPGCEPGPPDVSDQRNVLARMRSPVGEATPSMPRPKRARHIETFEASWIHQEENHDGIVVSKHVDSTDRVDDDQCGGDIDDLL